MNLYDNVKYLSTKQGISLPDLAEKMGLARTAIYKWKTQTPGIETIEKLAKYFDVSIEYLIDSESALDQATTEDIIDIEFLLNNYINLGYGTKKLTIAEIERAKIILDAIFLE
ncbi:helix-turn-helix domain-containing protein [Carnobacterium sp. FSL W8-0810]|uniref:helix-turn-helix domain-containing protein n=1 Tax=Carnobacterium sp. FSL W8-0810 TaxID=2954705 RepID=UPI0030F70CF6